MFLIIFTVIVGGIVWYFHHKLTFWQRQGVPTPGFMYQWHYYRRELGPYDQELLQKLGPVYGTYDALTPTLIVTEPELIREFLVKEFHNFPNHKPLRLGLDIIDRSIFSLDGSDDWKRIRSLMTPTFTTGKLRGMQETIHEAIETLNEHFVKAAKEGKAVDMKRLYNSLAFNVIVRCAYSTKVDVVTEENNPILTNLEDMSKGRFDIFVTMFFPNFAKRFGFDKTALKPFKFFEDMTKRMIEERTGPNKIRRNDFLQLMVEANAEAENNKEKDVTSGDSSKKTISTIEMMAQCIIFLTAGFDTSATIMACCAYHLSKHPEVQKKLTEEVSSLKEVNHDTVMELKYLEAVLKECFRLSPPVVRVERQCVNATKLGDITVQPGTIVSIPVFALHRDPRSYSNPEVFDPNRFLPGGADVNHDPYAYIPFGCGPRTCIAQRFALMEVKMALASVMQKFHFEATPETKLNYCPASLFVLAPLDIMVKVKAL